MTLLPRPSVATLLFTLVFANAEAAGVDVPLRHWQAPSAWAGTSTPASVHREGDAALANNGVQLLFLQPTMAQLVAIAPCRIVDTRIGYAAAYAPGVPLQAGVTTTFDLNSAPSPCNGIPSSAVAYSLNVTVTGSSGPGYLSAFPGSTAPSPLTSLVNFAGGQVIANASVIPGDSNGLVGFLASTTTDLVVDINGYYVGENKPAARYVSSTASSVPDHTYWHFDYQTRQYDTSNSVTTGAGAWTFTAPSAGIYRISAQTVFDTTGTGRNARIEIWVNGAAKVLGPFALSEYAGLPLMPEVTSELMLNVSDQVAIWGWQTSGASALTTTNPGDNWISISLVRACTSGSPCN